MSAVYRDYDQAGLDAQYNNRKTVPDPEVYVAEYLAESQRVRAALPPATQLAYGEGANERIDLFPAADPRAPLLVFLHGGAWQALSRAESAFPAAAFLKAGIGFAAVEFDLVPHVGLAKMVEQCRRALAALRETVQGPIIVGGHSSGGHLAGMMAVTEPVAGAILVSGMYDLEPVRLSYRNALLGLDEAGADALSAIHQIPAKPCPILLSWASGETDEFRRQPKDFAKAWRAAGGQATELEVPDHNHYNVILRLADPGHALHQAALKLIAGIR